MIIGKSDPVELPKPLGSYVLIRKEKRSLVSGLALPDSVDGAYRFYVEDLGPDVEGIEVGDRLELHPRRSLANAVMLSDDHALADMECFVGRYPK